MIRWVSDISRTARHLSSPLTPDPGAPRYPPYLYTLIESFCLGTRRLQLFAPPGRCRRGWVTASTEPMPPTSPVTIPPGQDAQLAYNAYSQQIQQYDSTTYHQLLPGQSEKKFLPYSHEIELLRPKSPTKGGKPRRGDPSSGFPIATSQLGSSGGQGSHGNGPSAYSDRGYPGQGQVHGQGQGMYASSTSNQRSGRSRASGTSQAPRMSHPPHQPSPQSYLPYGMQGMPYPYSPHSMPNSANIPNLSNSQQYFSRHGHGEDPQLAYMMAGMHLPQAQHQVTAQYQQGYGGYQPHPQHSHQHQHQQAYPYFHSQSGPSQQWMGAYDLDQGGHNLPQSYSGDNQYQGHQGQYGYYGQGGYQDHDQAYGGHYGS